MPAISEVVLGMDGDPLFSGEGPVVTPDPAEPTLETWTGLKDLVYFSMVS